MSQINKNNFTILLALITGSLFLSCEPQIAYQIDFCEQFGANDECNYDKDKFPMHQRIFVKFSSKEPLKDTLYIGNISVKKQDGQIESLGFKEFLPDPGATYVKHHIPFDVFGGFGSYLVEFKDSKDHILAKKEIHFETEK